MSENERPKATINEVDRKLAEECCFRAEICFHGHAVEQIAQSFADARSQAYDAGYDAALQTALTTLDNMPQAPAICTLVNYRAKLLKLIAEAPKPPAPPTNNEAIEQACAEGYAKGHSEGFEKGRKQGERNGCDRGFNEVFLNTYEVFLNTIQDAHDVLGSQMGETLVASAQRVMNELKRVSSEREAAEQLIADMRAVLQCEIGSGAMLAAAAAAAAGDRILNQVRTKMQCPVGKSIIDHAEDLAIAAARPGADQQKEIENLRGLVASMSNGFRAIQALAKLGETYETMVNKKR